MRALKGGVTRTSPDMRSADGRRSRAFQKALIQQFGQLPDVARPLVREAVLLDQDLVHLGAELEAARAQRRRRDVARLRRTRAPMLGQLNGLLARIEGLAKDAGKVRSLAEWLDSAANEEAV